MKSLKICGVFLAVAMTLLFNSAALSCNVCHSKNPRMVQMHKELGFKDCFNCHGKDMKKNPEEQKLQMANDQRCTGCHKK